MAGFKKNKSEQPAKPIRTPEILEAGIFILKKAHPITSVLKGVTAFSVPASALSIFSSATQKRMAGIKLPSQPEKSTIFRKSFGIWENAFKAKGIKTMPEVNILMAATCKGESRGDPSMANIPSFIRIKELPQMIHKSEKSNHFRLFLITFCPEIDNACMILNMLSKNGG
ncbi:MAG: hypothetical protein MUE99_06065 [Chitinophagaceae bacterium]|nr:hypothetical protein [Chitinophagaceae bacterium]